MCGGILELTVKMGCEGVQLSGSVTIWNEQGNGDLQGILTF
jgi:hypothetical protein